MSAAGRRDCLRAAAAGAALLLAACAGQPRKGEPQQVAVRVQNHGEFDTRTPVPQRRRSPYAPAQEDPSKRGNYTPGGLYAPGVPDSAPEGGIPDIDLIPEPEVVDEPRSRYGNRSPYTVLGKSYRVLDSAAGYDEVGIASYYGNKFHGRRTSNLEVYDMYAFTAAHKTLPLPSYARVTNLDNGRSVVVRVNDRGPFHDGRIIDLSYAAAVKLGVDRAGTARVRVHGLVPGEDAHVDYDAVAAAPAPAPAAPPAPSAIDRLVAALLIAAAEAGERPAAAVLPVAPAPVPAAPPTGVTFQVGTFADPANAQRALAILNGAGIAGARIEEGSSAGRPVWRVRAGPVAPEAAEELAARLRGLGFGQPARVRE